jgi:hypothetical protein
MGMFQVKEASKVTNAKREISSDITWRRALALVTNAIGLAIETTIRATTDVKKWHQLMRYWYPLLGTCDDDEKKSKQISHRSWRKGSVFPKRKSSAGDRTAMRYLPMLITIINHTPLQSSPSNYTQQLPQAFLSYPCPRFSSRNNRPAAPKSADFPALTSTPQHRSGKAFGNRLPSLNLFLRSIC